MKRKKMNGSRRSFLKRGAAGLAGIAVLPVALSRSAGGREKKQYRIVKRKLGGTGIELPVVSFGVGHVTNPELVAAALDAGIVHLDTAYSYQQGRNEEMIGGVLKGRPRDSFVVATKVTGAEDRRAGLFRKEATAEMFIEKFETSLGRLGLDHVDILYIHSVVKEGAAHHEPFIEALTRLKKQGKTRAIGVSTHGNEVAVIRSVLKHKIHEVVLTAYNFRQPHARELEAAMKDADKAGIGIVAMKTQAGTFWDRERQHPINMKAALKWVLRKPYVHTAIPGITTFDQLHEDMSIMAELDLTPVEKNDLRLGQRLGLPGLYCRQCGACRTQCVKGLDVPTLMRSFMYVYGHRDLAMAKEALRETELADDPCGDCGVCTVDCSMGFDVRGRVADVARIGMVPEEFVV